MNRTRGKAPWGLVGMLALVALGEWSLRAVEMDLLLPQHWDWRQAARASVSKEVVGSEVLCFGDSLMKQAVQPTVIAARTGRPTYNLAVALGQPPASYFLLRRALRAGARPKLILLDAAPFVLAMGPESPAVLRQWPELLDVGERFDLARAVGSPTLFLRLSLAGVFPSVRACGDVRAAAVSWASGKGPAGSRRFQMAQFARNGRVNRGANAMRYNPDFRFDLSELSAPMLDAFRCRPVNLAYLDRFLDLAAARRIPVVVLLPPLSPRAQGHTEGNGFDEAQTIFVNRLRSRHPGLTVADARRSGYGAELHYMDPFHLNHKGAVALSDDLAPVIDRVLAGGRVPAGGWVTMPRYSDRPRGVAVEDIDDSAMAITEGPRRAARR